MGPCFDMVMEKPFARGDVQCTGSKDICNVCNEGRNCLSQKMARASVSFDSELGIMMKANEWV